MSRVSNAELEIRKGEVKRKLRDKDIARNREGLKINPLYRETMSEGLIYDSGDPYREFAYHMVNGHSPRNIVLRTSRGLVVEATPKKVRYRNKNRESINTSLEFNPNAPTYVLEAPYFIKVASVLSHFTRIALSNLENVSLELDVKDPFGDGSK
ncbi:MAG: hypothetical protein WCK29_02805 [archaeon]